jgi:HD-GYP domain-containing protein (c-di-GMP phosphodiesterase class II)
VAYGFGVGGVEGSETTRMAELLAALSFGIDLGFGQPMEHVLRQCRIALRLCELAAPDDDERVAVYYSALLVNVGCHSDAYEQAYWFGDDIALKATKYDHEPYSTGDIATMLRLLGSGGSPLHRVRVAFDFVISGRKEVDGMIAGHARLARTLAEELGLPGRVTDAVATSYERWDGKGWPGRLAGDAIPLASRIIQLAEFVEVAHRTGGIDAAEHVATRRAGKQFDPRLVSIFVADAEKVLHGIDDVNSWDAVIDDEPALSVDLAPEECDAALAAIARFVDLKSPFTLGHSESVATLVGSAAEQLRFPASEVRSLRRAALVAGYGRLGVSNAIWDKRGPLTAGEWERVRLAPHLTERMLHRSEALAPVGRIAGQLRERLDGSGYPRGLSGSGISRAGRLHAAADAYQAMREPRPHRDAMSAGDAAQTLREEVRSGRMDGEAVEAVLRAAGLRSGRRREGPAGLTAREMAVLGLLARGMSNKEIAARLVITPKTAGNHVEHIYAKLGVSNRAAASLFAMQHGLLPDDS